MMTEIQEMAAEAKAYGLVVVVWSYPRGGDLTKQGETAVDIVAYAAHMAALLGAHIIKVKPPTAQLELEAAKKVLRRPASPSERSRSGSPTWSSPASTAAASWSSPVVRRRTSTVSITRSGNSVTAGRTAPSSANTFQRPREESLAMLSQIIDIYRGKA